MIKQKLFWYKVFFFINIAVNWTEKVNQVFFIFISLHVPKNNVISGVETWIGRLTLFSKIRFNYKKFIMKMFLALICHETFNLVLSCWTNQETRANSLQQLYHCSLPNQISPYVVLKV